MEVKSQIHPEFWDNEEPLGHDPRAYFDENHKIRGNNFDLIWRAWRTGKLTTTLGKHNEAIEIPEGWFQYIEQEGLLVPDVCSALKAEVNVVAQVVTIKGQAKQHTLINATDQTAIRGSTEVTFPPFEVSEDGAIVLNDLSAISIRELRTETELKDYLLEQATDNIINTVVRKPLPRIRVYSPYGEIYYPPSEKVVQKIDELFNTFGSPASFDSKVIGDDPFGENNLDSAWDPIHPDHIVD